MYLGHNIEQYVIKLYIEFINLNYKYIAFEYYFFYLISIILSGFKQ